MLTALLIDGTANPIAYRTDTKAPSVNWGVRDKPTRQFNLARTEGKDNSLLIYRLVSLSDEVFEAQSAAEADKFLHPEKYKMLGTPKDEARKLRERLEDAEAELEAYRQQHGTLGKKGGRSANN